MPLVGNNKKHANLWWGLQKYMADPNNRAYTVVLYSQTGLKKTDRSVHPLLHSRILDCLSSFFLNFLFILYFFKLNFYLGIQTVKMEQPQENKVVGRAHTADYSDEEFRILRQMLHNAYTSLKTQVDMLVAFGGYVADRTDFEIVNAIRYHLENACRLLGESLSTIYTFLELLDILCKITETMQKMEGQSRKLMFVEDIIWLYHGM